MTLEVLIIVAVTGLAASLVRIIARRAGARPVADLELQSRITDRSLGVRDGGDLDVWVPANTPVPARVVRLLRGRPEPGRGLRLTLYAGTDRDQKEVGQRIVRTWLGPYPDRREPVLVEVTLSVGRAGNLKLRAIDKATGRKLAITRDERTAAPVTQITTREALSGEDAPPG